MASPVLAPDGAPLLWPDGTPILWPDGADSDVTEGSIDADVSGYLALITSEHASKPNFLAVVSTLVQGFADEQVVLASMPGLYDLDNAAGVQLDAIGLWVGRTRFLAEPLTGVYFSWGTSGVGWGQGTWKGPFDPSTGLVALPDAQYRTLLRAVIAANQWDGTIPGAYTVWNTLFAGTGFGILIQDNGDMTMLFALTGPAPDAVTLALFTSGYLTLKPAGVRATYLTQSVPSTPYFGWGVENGSISGWGVGAWAKFGPST